MLVICLLTKNRLDYAQRAIRSLSKLKTSSDIHFHIADDGSGLEYTNSLARTALEVLKCEVTMTDSHDKGYGANYNLAMQTCHIKGAYQLPLEDDWELVRELDIDPILHALEEEIFGCVRMGYVGYTQSLMAKFVSYGGYNYLELNEFSSEPHVFAGHPRIETTAWSRTVGPWPTGLGAGATEFEVAHRPEARKNVAWPVDLIKPSGDAFCHIGTEHAVDPTDALHQRVG